MAEDLINKVSSNKYFDENSTPRLKETASTKEAV